MSAVLQSILFSRPKEEVTIKKEKRERDRDRQREGHGRGRGRPEVIQSHSIFEQGPAEMMKKKGTDALGRKGSVDVSSDCLKEGQDQWNFPAPSLVFLADVLFLPPGELDVFPQATGIRQWMCRTWGPLISSTSKKRRGKQMKKQNRSCACWRRMMWVPAGLSEEPSL